ncbi:MAG: two-component sensor histidine kinase [Synechococcales cyanobacterium T60_A2020_003]|nr:two-component sensor histidine kinase [Synechococcales cyanobacterium T60_A2020_003]
MLKGLGLHLLLAYLSVIAGVFGTSALAVYLFFVNSLYQQVDSRLLTLAQSATPTLADVKREGEGHLEEREEIPWQDLFRRNSQSLTWFDAEGNVIASQGTSQVSYPAKEGILTLGNIRTYTIAVYLRNPGQSEPRLEGYIRASESIDDIQDLIVRLRWGFALGGSLALGLSALGSVWLVQMSLYPTRHSLEQLRQFTADASHELRSPLTAIKTSVDVILKHPERIHPKDVKKLSAIASATNQMKHLVEDLLFLARTDSTHAPQVTHKPVHLDQVLQELINLLEPQAQQKGIRLWSELLPEMVVLGDDTKLIRLFSNLLENALQYTPSGGSVGVIMRKAGKMVEIDVRDTGMGIAPERLPFVFQRLWRADRARTYRAGGLGLGLSIALAIASQHDGEISVSSQIGQGSTFQVRLPRFVEPRTEGRVRVITGIPGMKPN